MKLIKSYIIPSLLFVLMFFIFSCAERSVDIPIDTGKVSLKIDITRTPGVENIAAENRIANARILVFANNGALLINKYKTGSNISFMEIVPTGVLSIYLIANELPSWNLSAVTTISQLKSKTLTYSAYPVVDDANLVPMMGVYERVTISANGSLTMNGAPLDLSSAESATVQRLYAKVSLNLTAKYENLPGNSPSLTVNRLTFESISIKRMPRISYLSSTAYLSEEDSGYFNGVSAPISNVVYAADKITFSGAFYVPEYIVYDITKYSYVSLEGYLNSDISAKVRYKLIVGDGIGTKSNVEMGGSSVSTVDLRVTRNTHYTYTVNAIRGFGDIEGLEIFQEVKPWGTTTIPSQVQERKLNVSALTRTVTETAPTRLYFWSNQPADKVSIEDYGYVGTVGTGTYTVNDYFVSISGVGASNFHYTYNDALKTGSGYVDIQFKPGKSTVDGRVIVVNANGLKREVTINTAQTQRYLPQWKTEPVVHIYHEGGSFGERIVRGRNTGTWTAQVDNPKARLSVTPSTDRYIFSHIFSDPDDFPVTETTTTVTGYGDIYFRFGWDPSYQSTQLDLARITVTTHEDGKTYVIYARRSAKRIREQVDTYQGWAITNLKGFFSGTEIGGDDVANHPILVPQATLLLGNITTYDPNPSSVGSFCQWNSGDNTLAPFRFYAPNKPGLTLLIRNYPISLKTSWNSAHDPCPSGYHTPTEAEFIGTASSLFLADNYRWGSCADGYFDRMQRLTEDITVSDRPYSVGLGFVIYKDSESMFLPMTNSRDQNGILIAGTGFYAVKSDVRGRVIAMNPRFTSTSNVLSSQTVSPSVATSVRCVKN